MAAYTTINDPSAFFKCQLYTGNGSANHAITFDDTDTDMQPDMVWIKNRDATDSHCLFDAVRGATKVLHSDATNAEATDADTLDSFTSDGFQVDADVKVNTNTEDYVSWNWKAGTTSGITTNASTTITPSAYSFNQTQRFSVIKYTGNVTEGGGSSAKVAHGCGVAPNFIIVKKSSASGTDWVVFHSELTSNNYYLSLNKNDAQSTGTNRWNDTNPDAVNFTLGDSGSVSYDGATFIAYCFANVKGFSKFGSYIGNGNADGTFVYTGFRPAWLMLKNASSGSTDWPIYDNKRPGYNDANYYLPANRNIVENTVTPILLLSNGFKALLNHNDSNGSGDTIVYAAFAEAPFVNSNGVPCNAR